MECRALRIFYPRSGNKVILFGVAITTFLCISWEFYYLARTTQPILGIEKNDIRDFHQQWCRMQRWRVDWEGMAKPCEGQVAWNQRQVNSEWRTDARSSFIRKWEIQAAGHFSSFFIQSVTTDGVLKSFGGDAWRVYIRQGPASLAPQVWDHDNGLYQVVFLAMEPGDYTAQITLDFTLCDGLREPPVDWFIIGTVQGKYQADGILGYIGDDYILEPLAGQTAFTFSVPESSADATTGSFAIPVYVDVPESGHFESTHPSSMKTTASCGTTCNLLHNGFGRWVSGRWMPYIQDSLTDCDSSTKKQVKHVTRGDTLWIYGDSVAQNFLTSLRTRGTCKQHFKKCRNTYMWIYEMTSVEEAKSKFEPTDFNKAIILKQMSDILDSPDMRTQNSVFVFNLGVHYSISLNFTTYKDLIDSVVKLIKNKIEHGHGHTAVPVWKTTTSIEKENTHKMFAELPRNKTHWRFHTHQRLELFHKYAVSAMCKAGIPVLDVYPMTFSYPNGTRDHVHYNANAQKAAEDQLLAFITDNMKRKQENANMQT